MKPCKHCGATVELVAFGCLGERWMDDQDSVFCPPAQVGRELHMRKHEG